MNFILSSYFIYIEVLNFCEDGSFIYFESTTENIIEEYNHVVPEGSKFMKCQYYQKEKEQRFGIHYKLLPKSVYIFLTQVLFPLFNLDKNKC